MPRGLGEGHTLYSCDVRQCTASRADTINLSLMSKILLSHDTDTGPKQSPTKLAHKEALKVAEERNAKTLCLRSELAAFKDVNTINAAPVEELRERIKEVEHIGERSGSKLCNLTIENPHPEQQREQPAAGQLRASDERVRESERGLRLAEKEGHLTATEGQECHLTQLCARACVSELVAELEAKLQEQDALETELEKMGDMISTLRSERESGCGLLNEDSNTAGPPSPQSQCMKEGSGRRFPPQTQLEELTVEVEVWKEGKKVIETDTVQTLEHVIARAREKVRLLSEDLASVQQLVLRSETQTLDDTSTQQKLSYEGKQSGLARVAYVYPVSKASNDGLIKYDVVEDATTLSALAHTESQLLPLEESTLKAAGIVPADAGADCRQNGAHRLRSYIEGVRVHNEASIVATARASQRGSVSGGLHPPSTNDQSECLHCKLEESAPREQISLLETMRKEMNELYAQHAEDTRELHAADEEAKNRDRQHQEDLERIRELESECRTLKTTVSRDTSDNSKSCRTGAMPIRDMTHQGHTLVPGRHEHYQVDGHVQELEQKLVNAFRQASVWECKCRDTESLQEELAQEILQCHRTLAATRELEEQSQANAERLESQLRAERAHSRAQEEQLQQLRAENSRLSSRIADLSRLQLKEELEKRALLSAKEEAMRHAAVMSDQALRLRKTREGYSSGCDKDLQVCPNVTNKLKLEAGSIQKETEGTSYVPERRGGMRNVPVKCLDEENSGCPRSEDFASMPEDVSRHSRKALELRQRLEWVRFHRHDREKTRRSSLVPAKTSAQVTHDLTWAKLRVSAVRRKDTTTLLHAT
eukprot:scaffold4473_cov421-Prasinococcus_capsulatus_cf.AAC.2